MKKRVFSFVLAVILCFGMLAAMPRAAGAVSSAQVNPVVSGNYAVKTDGTLWDNISKKTVMEDVKAIQKIEDANESSRGFALKTDGTLWDLAFMGHKYRSDDVYWPDYMLMDGVSSIVPMMFQKTVLAVKTDGSLWRCGDWELGGPGDKVKRIPPEKLMDGVASVLYGWGVYEDDGTTYVIKTDGSLWVWGGNQDGEAGVGTNAYCETPVKIMDNVVSVAYGYDSTWMGSRAGGAAYALQSDGSLWAWGLNRWNQLGDGTSTNSTVPVKIMEDVQFMDADYGQAAAIKKDGSLWSWGIKQGASADGGSEYSGSGAAMIVTNEINRDPVKMADNAVSLVCSSRAVYFTKSDGTLWYWGGGFGSDPLLKTVVPVKLLDDLHADSPVFGAGFAVKTDNSLWAWDDSFGLETTYGIVTGDIGNDWGKPVKVTDGVKASAEAAPAGDAGTTASPGTFAPAAPPASPGTAASSGTATPDKPSSWAEAQVNAAIEANLVPVALQSKYTQAVTRAEFCALAVAMYESMKGEITERKTFTDTTDINAEKAAAIGVTSGMNAEGTLFSPGTPLTREQAAGMLSRLSAAVGSPLTGHGQGKGFADSASISDWAVGAVNQVQAAGIMGSTSASADVFSPQGPYTREQSIVTVLRLYTVVNRIDTAR